MSKGDRLCNRVEPFATLFLALGIVLANTGPCLPASLHTAVHKACPYMVIVGSILNEDVLPPPFPILVRYLRVSMLLVLVHVLIYKYVLHRQSSCRMTIILGGCTVFREVQGGGGGGGAARREIMV